MVEQLNIEQLVSEEERHLGRIARIQQLADTLDIGPKDLSQRSLTQARTTVRFLRATSYIGRIQTRLAPISAEMDRQTLVLAEDHERQLQGMITDLTVVETARVSPFTMRDIMRFRQEVLDFRQRPFENPLLARGIRLYRQDREVLQTEAAEPTENIRLTYADIEQRGIHFGPIQRRLMEELLPYASTAELGQIQDTLLASQWAASVWPDADRAKRLGRLGTHVYKMRATLSGCGLSIVNVEPLNASLEGRFYLYVDTGAKAATTDTADSVEEDDFLMEKVSPIDNYRGVAAKVWREMGSSRVDTNQFIADFLGSEDAYSFLNFMLRFSRRFKAGKLSKEEENLFYQHASGNLTELLAYRHLNRRYQAEGLTMLSPHQKFTLYRNAYPKEDIEEDQFGINREIKGVPSPDSLLIRVVPQEAPKHLEIVSVIEVKNVTDESPEILEYMKRQHARYTLEGVAFNLRLNNPKMRLRLGRLLHKLDPSLPDDLPLIVNPDMEVIYVEPIDAPKLPLRNIKQPEHIPPTSGEIASLVRILPAILSQLF